MGRPFEDSINGGIGICLFTPTALRTPVADALEPIGDKKLYPAAVKAPALSPPMRKCLLFIVILRLKSSLYAQLQSPVPTTARVLDESNISRYGGSFESFSIAAA